MGGFAVVEHFIKHCEMLYLEYPENHVSKTSKCNNMNISSQHILTENGVIILSHKRVHFGSLFGSQFIQKASTNFQDVYSFEMGHSCAPFALGDSADICAP